jgi:hypothetical protein
MPYVSAPALCTGAAVQTCTLHLHPSSPVVFTLLCRSSLLAPVCTAFTLQCRPVSALTAVTTGRAGAVQSTCTFTPVSTPGLAHVTVCTDPVSPGRFRLHRNRIRSGRSADAGRHVPTFTTAVQIDAAPVQTTGAPVQKAGWVQC